MKTLTPLLRRTSVGGKLSLFILVLQLVGFVGLAFFLSQSSLRQINAEVGQGIQQQQKQVANMMSLFDETLQQQAGNMLHLLLRVLNPTFEVDTRRRIEVAGRQTPTFSNGGEPLNGDYTLADEFTVQTGAPVTFFARDGDDFVRVSTSVKNASGERAVGTLLNRESKSYARLMAGETYSGIAELFGTPYITIYEPVRNRQGEVVGAAFIGIDIVDELAMLQERIRGISYYRSGYAMLVDAGAAQQGRIIAGGPYENESLETLKTTDSLSILSELTSSPSGQFEYVLEGSDSRPQIMYFQHYPEWNWIITGTVFVDEMEAGIITMRNWSLLAALLLALGFSALLYYYQRNLISRPLDATVAMAQQLAKGDLSQRHSTQREDEIGKLLVAMNGIGEGLSRIALQLEPYAVGRHATWFNGEPQLDLSNEFTILELEELNVDRELRNVVMTLLMARTTRDMYLRPRNIPKMMLIDEAWDLLADPKSGKFIETAFRRIRKYYGSAGFITQGFKDTDLSPAAQAAFDNAPWTFVLKQSGPSLDYAQKNGKLGGEDEFLFDMLRGVKPGAGYSEVFVKHESGGGLFRFVVDKYSYFLYSTNPKDQARLMKLTEAGHSTQEAIRMLAEGQG